MTDLRVYTIIVHDTEEDEVGYWAEVEELPGCFSSGDTLEELEQDVKDAIETHLAALKEIGQPIPQGRRTTDARMRRWEIAVTL
jgi:predicted RNase H-like HicB family nuclease